MKTWVRKSLNVGVLSAGFLLFTGAAANADMGSSQNLGLLNGTQLDNGIQVPVNLCGNAIGLIGSAGAECDGGGAAALAAGERGGAMNSRGNVGALNGTQLGSTIQVPVNVCGNAIGGLLGSAAASCGGGAAAGSGNWWNDDDDNGGGSGGYAGSSSYDDENSRARGTARRIGAFDRTWSTGAGSMNTAGNVGALNGTQVNSLIQVPVNVCGNAVGLLGGGGASCGGGAAALSGGGGAGGAMNSGGSLGIGNGTQVGSLIQVPVNVCGNSIGGLFGNAAASCDGGGAAAGAGHWWNNDDSDDSDDSDDNGDDPYYEEPTGAGTAGAHSNGAVNAAHKAAKSAAKAAKKIAAATVVDENGRGAGQARNKGNGQGMGKGRGNNLGRGHGLGIGNGLGHGLGLGRPLGTWHPGHHGHNGGTGSSNGYGSSHGTGRGTSWWWGSGAGFGSGGAFDTDGCGGGSMSSVGNFGLLNGTQLGSTIQIPLNVTGNAIGVLGTAGAMSNGGATAASC